jgi:predicted ATPase
VARHRTLKGALEWSYELLSEPERILFRKLSVFAGGWALEGAEAVGSSEGVAQSEVLELLSHTRSKEQSPSWCSGLRERSGGSGNATVTLAKG